MRKVDWIIHYVNNSSCEICGSKKTELKKGLCNAHTHGLNRYGHKELQIVLDLGPATVGYTLNTLGKRIQEGKIYKEGDIVDDMFQNGIKIRFKEVSFEGETLLRIIFPDAKYRFPNNAQCDYPYNAQYLDEKGIYLNS